MFEQKAVTETKVKISIKEQEIVELKAKMDEQCREALKEKQVLVNRLEELNIELKDREVVKDLHEEKLQVIRFFLNRSSIKNLNYSIYLINNENG